jgi:1,4-dihydroxy-6-naphthoate synthase
VSQRPLRLGISTCPNDTFAFHGLLSRGRSLGERPLEFELADVQELNERFLAGDFDAAKVSCHAALQAADRLWWLRSGSALGHGVGPLVLATRPDPPADPRVLAPGEHTTAHLLWRLFHPGEGRVEQRVFSEIMPALERGDADVGVCIHEGRFTYAERGLACLEDLGETWERATGAALPLGGIAARRSLPDDAVRDLEDSIAWSIDFARAHPDGALETMRAHAQELSDEVLWQHVELYVNRHTADLGFPGRRALAALAERARAAGLDVPHAGLECVPRPDRARLFHFTTREALEAARAAGEPLTAASLESEGFVHASFADQLAGTLAVHFAEARAVHLVELDESALGDALVIEPSRGGRLFPHVYGALPLAAIRQDWALERGPDGWQLPML